MTEPLVPAEVDLRDFGFMPLDVLRLRDSDLAALATGEEFKAAVLLWCVAWHQVPAASLPNDDRLLARYSGAGSAWRKVKTEALRGFVECTDGRLYHPTIAEKALEAWASKQARKARTAAATAAREAKRREQDAQRDDERHIDRDEQRDVKRDVHQGTGTGTGKGKKRTKAPLSAVGLPTWMQSVIDLWHEILPELPGVVVINAERKAAIQDFRDWVLSTPRKDGTPRATNDEEFLAWTRNYLERARENDFIMGRTPRTPEHRNWKPSIEWLLSSKGMQKVIEQTHVEEQPA